MINLCVECEASPAVRRTTESVETWVVQGRSPRSPTLPPFDKTCTTLYSPAVVAVFTL